MPMRRSGNRSSVPFRMRSVHASAAAVHRNTDSSGGTPKSSGCVYHASSNGRRWSATWNTGVTPVLDEGAPDRIVRRVRQRAAVDERGRDHREAAHHRARVARARPSTSPRRAASRARPGARGPRRPSTTDAHQRFHAVMFAVSARQVGVERAFPREPEVREHHRFVDAHDRQSVGARSRVPVVARKSLVVARPRPGARRECVRGGRRARDVWPGYCTSTGKIDRVPPAQPRVARARRPRCAGRRRGSRDRCGRARSCGSRTDADRSRSPGQSPSHVPLA